MVTPAMASGWLCAAAASACRARTVGQRAGTEHPYRSRRDPWRPVVQKMGDSLQTSSSPKPWVAQPSIHHCPSPPPTLLPAPPAHLPPTLLVLLCAPPSSLSPALSLPALCWARAASVVTHCRWPDCRLGLSGHRLLIPRHFMHIVGPQDVPSEKTKVAKCNYFFQSPLKYHLSHIAFDMFPPFNIFYI